MIATTPAYDTAAALRPMKPVHLFRIDGYDTVFVWRPTGRTNERAWITGIDDWGLSVDEQNGSCTIDDLSISVLDYGAAVTQSIKLIQLEGRRCELLTGFDGVDLADYATVFTGVVNNITRNTDSTYSLVCNDLNRIAQRIIYLQGDSKTVTVAVTTYTGSVYITNTTVTKYDSDGNVLSVSTDTSQSVNGTVGTVTTTDNYAISTDNPRRVVGHPLDIVLNILQEQIGFADTDINLTLLQAYRDQVFAGMVFDFTLTSAVNAKDFIEQQLLKPLGGYNYQDNLGRFCVNFMLPLPASIFSALSLDQTNMVELPQLTQSTVVNVLTHRFDKDEQGNYMAERNNLYAAIGQDITDITGELAEAEAAGNSNLQGQVIIESDGMRSGFQGFLLADAVAQSYFNKYGNNNLTLQPHVFWSSFKLMPGEFVLVSHPLLPYRKGGVIGLPPTLFQVNSRHINFTDLTVTLVLTDASGMQAALAHKIVADNYSNTYATASPADRAMLAFMTATNGKQSNGDDGVMFG